MIITITGYPGAGKSTVGRILAKKLRMKYYYTGDLMRKMAKERNITLEEMQRKAEKDFEYDRKIDAFSLQLARKHRNFILDARLGFYFIPDSVKVYLSVDPEIAAKRIVNDKRPEESKSCTKKQAIKKIKERVSSENKRYKRYYNVVIHDPRNYDIIIDTTNMTPEEIADSIIKIIKKNKNK